MRHPLLEDFVKSKAMAFPRSVLVGHGVLEELPATWKVLGLRGRGLVVTGGRTRALAGDKVREILAKAGHEVDDIEVNGATDESVLRVVEKGRAMEVGAIFGVGGGSVIDVAKLAAFDLGVPYVSVPTSASHDGLTSPRASIKRPDGKGSSSREAETPLGIVADTSIIVRAPYRMLAAGCADAISNYTAVLDWKLAHRLKGESFSSFAAVLAQTAAELIISHADSIKPNLEESSWVVVKSLIVSGVSMSVAGTSRPASGAEHMISHTLDVLAPGRAYHGEQVGVASIMTMYLHGGDWERIRDSLKAVGAPTTARELGIPEDVMIEALTMAHANKPDRYTILGESGLTRQAAEDLLRATGVA